LRVLISEEQTKETDEKVEYLFLGGLQNFVIDRAHPVETRFIASPPIVSFRLAEAVSKAVACRHCEEERRSNPVIINHFRIASLRYQ
jgi:hypothetical protein